MATGGESLELPTPPNLGASKYGTAKGANDAARTAAKLWLAKYVNKNEIRIELEKILDTKFNTLYSENTACDGTEKEGCPKHTVMIVGEFNLPDDRKPFNLKVTFDVDIKPMEKSTGKDNKPKNPKTKGPEPDKKDHKQAPHIGWEMVRGNEQPVRVKPKTPRGNMTEDDKRLANDADGHCYVKDGLLGARRPKIRDRKNAEAGNAPEGEGVGVEKVDEPPKELGAGLTLTFYKLKGPCVIYDGVH